MTDAERQKPSDHSLGLAAQAWCEPETSHKIMDEALCTAFARILDRALAQSDAEPVCKICGGSGYTRYLGRDNSEEVEDCSCRQSDAEPQRGEEMTDEERQELCADLRASWFEEAVDEIERLVQELSHREIDIETQRNEIERLAAELARVKEDLRLWEEQG